MRPSVTSGTREGVNITSPHLNIHLLSSEVLIPKEALAAWPQACLIAQASEGQRRICAKADAQDSVVKLQQVDMACDALPWTIRVCYELIKQGPPPCNVGRQ